MTPRIRLSTPADTDAILKFIEENGFNPRDKITWVGLQMGAMTAWVGERLIGAIPFEPRTLRISATETIQSIHETVVAVDPEFRGSGIGSQLQQALADDTSAGAKLITVFREEPESAAYRWYLKNKFAPAMNIRSWLCFDSAKIAVQSPERNVDDVERLRAINHGGMIDRHTRPLNDWLSVHPYRNRYQFHKITVESGYALLGVGKMHSATLRADLLEFVANDPETLIRHIAAISLENGWNPVRFAMANGDSNEAITRSLGFQIDRSFDLLARPMGSLHLQTRDWRYAGIDYI